MKLKLETLIIKESIGFESNSLRTFNQIFGSDFDDNFVIKSLKIQDFEIEESEKNVFSFDLSTIVPDISKLSMVAIFCQNLLKSPTDLPDNVKFDLSIDGNVLSKTCQFILANIEDANFTEITVNNFDVKTGKTAQLTIVTAYK